MKSIALSRDISIDLLKLIESRLLVQANSGGGKSWATRRIIEQAFGKVQIIVIDPEGEFANLREKYDFVYAGKEGDAPAESRSAALLARRLLELKASAIIDLYELPPQERKHFVRLFCEALVNAPKELWHDCLVIIDEAHIFCPEKGESEAMGPVIDLASRGRKRGFCAVLVTQRISKLNKDAAAECNNKLIGRASLDIDRKRAAEELGFTAREEILSLRNLEPGEFYVFGPAISRDVVKTTIGDVSVKPAARGQSKHALPPPTEKVRSILAKLADLPQEAQKEAQTIAELKAEIATLKRHKCVPQSDPAVVKNLLKDQEQRFRGRETDILRAQRKAAAFIEEFVRRGEEVLNVVTVSAEVPTLQIKASVPPTPPIAVSPKLMASVMSAASEKFDLSGPEQRILDAIAWMESIGITEPEQTAVAFLADYTFGGGGFNNPRGSLRTKGLVEYRGDKIALTDAGRELAHVPEATLTNAELHRKVLERLPGPERKLLTVLLERHPEDISTEELAEQSGYVHGAGGFNNPRGRLRSLGLIEYLAGGRVKAKSLLFPNTP
jgi:uncharacterized protein